MFSIHSETKTVKWKKLKKTYTTYGRFFFGKQGNSKHLEKGFEADGYISIVINRAQLGHSFEWGMINGV